LAPVFDQSSLAVMMCHLLAKPAANETLPE
jgi:hypothetical protein